MNSEEIMDMEHAKEEKRKRDMRPPDDDGEEYCELCWYPVKECRCEKEVP